MQSDICKNCGWLIHLVPSGQHFKWVTNPNDINTWHCGSDPDFPVLTHAPTNALSGG